MPEKFPKSPFLHCLNHDNTGILVFGKAGESQVKSTEKKEEVFVYLDRSEKNKLIQGSSKGGHPAQFCSYNCREFFNSWGVQGGTPNKI